MSDEAQIDEITEQTNPAIEAKKVWSGIAAWWGRYSKVATPMERRAVEDKAIGGIKRDKA